MEIDRRSKAVPTAKPSILWRSCLLVVSYFLLCILGKFFSKSTRHLDPRNQIVAVKIARGRDASPEEQFVNHFGAYFPLFRASLNDIPFERET